MIKNERQYRITKSQAEKFETAIRELEEVPEKNRELHPLLYKAQVDALRSQLRDLQEEILDYEHLRDGKEHLLKIDSFNQIAHALIRARIAVGLTQDQLAVKLGIKPQQVQRYEATEYKSASLTRVAEVAKVLGLKMDESILLPAGPFTFRAMLARLESVGLQRDFIVQRLLPKPPGILNAGDVDREDGQSVFLEAAEGIHRIYGWTPAAVFGEEPLEYAGTASATARFKLPGRVSQTGLGAYIVYAHYLALLLLHATRELPIKRLETDPQVIRREILAQYGELTFEATLKYIWSKGVPVLSLNDPGAFHGACWRIQGRNVIVLKQRTRSVARWHHDLLHEYYHAASDPDLEEHPIIEESEMSPIRRESREEQTASQFAGDVMLAGRAEELAQLCVEEAKGSVERLKSAVISIAKQQNVATDALANYMAFRLSLQNINWWGAANNLQNDGSKALGMPRDLLLERANLASLNGVDRNLLLRAVETLVLAFAGKIGSGKSTLSIQVAKALGWKRASFGDYIRTVARSEGLGESREILQELGSSLVKNPKDFCRAMLAHFQWEAGEPLVIDGVRHAEIAEALRVIVAPIELRMIYLEVDEEIRLQRIREEDAAEAVPERMNRIESHSTEEQVSSRLPGLADLTVSVNRPADVVAREIVNWVHYGNEAETFCTR